MTSFYATIGGQGMHADLVLALRVEGIPTAFVERTIPASVATSLTGYTQFVGVTRIEEGEAQLNFDERREIANTLDVELLDDSTSTLASLFAVNTRRITWFSANSSATSTSLTFASTASFVNGQVIYTDAETIVLGTVGTPTAGCTRGAFGSTGFAVYASAAGNDGDSVYMKPPNWIGRRAYLYGYTLDANGGGYEQILGTFIIDEPPRHTGDNSWSLRCAGIAQEYYERTIGSNLKFATVKREGGVTYTAGTPGYFTFKVDDANAFRVSLDTDWKSYVLMRVDGADQLNSIYRLKGVDTINSTISVYEVPEFGTGTSEAGTTWQPPAEGGGLVQVNVNLRHIIYAASSVTFQQLEFVGGTNRAMLYVLLSSEGRLTNDGSYDRLPGRASTSVFDAGWRMGAGFKPTEIDKAAFESFDVARPSVVIIDDELKVSDVLKEWCLLNNMALSVTADGKLTPFSLSGTRTSTSTVIDSTNVIPGSRVEVEADESSIYPLISIKTNYSPMTRDFDNNQINLIDQYLGKRYGRTPRKIEFKLRSIGCPDAPKANLDGMPFSGGANVHYAELPAIVSNIVRGDSGLARRYVSLSLTMAMANLRIGDVVKLQNLPDAFSGLPDMAGGTLDGAFGRVVSRRPRYNDGQIDVRLMILEPLLFVCPTALVGGNTLAVLTLSTTDDCADSTPANDFFVGASVALYDLGAGTRTSYTVSAIPATNQITLNATPAAAVGTRYIVLDPVAGPTSGTTQSGYDLSELAITVDDDGVGTPNGAVNNKPRWR